MLSWILKKIVGTRNDRYIASLNPIIKKAAELEASLIPLTDAELQAKTAIFKERISRGESLESIMPEAFAVAREASKRVLGMRHFDVQLVGGAVLNSGKVAEMRTGEGKTLVATLPVYLNALTGKGVHVVTVNDYLAKRDAEWMGRLYNFLGLSVGVVVSGMPEQVKQRCYQADITYGQNNEFGFDYLRDNMKFSTAQQFQRGHNFAIVDEVDSILIDEARTPLIISGPSDESTDKYNAINKIIPFLKEGTEFEMDLKSKSPSLNEVGVARVEELLEVGNLYDPINIETLHHVVQGLKAYTTMHRDTDYVVKDGQIIIVDEFTGRLMPGRRWSDGLHQAIEAKEGLKVQRENQTLASITFQNYFRMYDKLAGMTGTADTEAVELKSIYDLEVIVIPPNRSMIREDQTDMVFRSRKEKYEAVAKEIEEAHEKGQPTLVGTISIEQSETLSKLLTAKDIQHTVLNAKHHEKEAEIIAQAGRYGMVTISTNMAGRGTDILLGGNPEFLAANETGSKDPTDQAFIEALAKYKLECEEEKAKVVAAGGLYVMGTERHESRRIDNQLRGRAGRQGDPGKSRFYISMEDDLMKRFAGDKLQAIMSRMGWEEGAELSGRMVSHSIRTAQSRVEAFHFESRKHVTEYDDVMNKQRQVVYNLRNRILANQGLENELDLMLEDTIEQYVITACPENIPVADWNISGLGAQLQDLLRTQLNIENNNNKEALYNELLTFAKNALVEKSSLLSTKLTELAGVLQAEYEFDIKKLSEQEDGGKPKAVPQPPKIPDFESFLQTLLLESLDYFWNQHLRDMDHLREGIGLRGYGQKNPLYEYQKEGFLLFQRLITTISEGVIRKLFYSEIVSSAEFKAQLEAERERREARLKKIQLQGPDESTIEEPAKTESSDVQAQRERLEQLKKDRRKMR